MLATSHNEAHSTVTHAGSLRVTGLGLARTGEPGPALIGSTSWSLVLAVSDSDGTPASGLTASAFSVSAVVSRRGSTKVVTLDAATVAEPMPGIYDVQLHGALVERLSEARVPCVVDVRRGDAHGRALVKLGT
jgi:hypothetical protein